MALPFQDKARFVIAGDEAEGDVLAGGGVVAEEFCGLLGLGGPARGADADAGGGVLVEAVGGVEETERQEQEGGDGGAEEAHGPEVAGRRPEHIQAQNLIAHMWGWPGGAEAEQKLFHIIGHVEPSRWASGVRRSRSLSRA